MSTGCRTASQRARWIPFGWLLRQRRDAGFDAREQRAIDEWLKQNEPQRLPAGAAAGLLNLDRTDGGSLVWLLL